MRDHKPAVWFVCAGLLFAGCAKPAEGGLADAMAQRPLPGVTATDVVLDDAKALAVLRPEGTEKGIQDVAHLETAAGGLTIYQYADPAAAAAAMVVWRTGPSLTVPGMIIQRGREATGVEADENVIVSMTDGTSGTQSLVVHKGVFIVTVPGSELDAVPVANALLAGEDGSASP